MIESAGASQTTVKPIDESALTKVIEALWAVQIRAFRFSHLRPAG